MSVLTYMNGIPLYSTINEALEWARLKGISNYHVHKYESVAGYMGGKNHKQASMYPGDLPAKEETKPGYTPKVGSRVISIINGKTSEYIVARSTSGPVKQKQNTIVSRITVPQLTQQQPTRLMPVSTSGGGGY